MPWNGEGPLLLQGTTALTFTVPSSLTGLGLLLNSFSFDLLRVWGMIGCALCHPQESPLPMLSHVARLGPQLGRHSRSLALLPILRLGTLNM